MDLEVNVTVTTTPTVTPLYGKKYVYIEVGTTAVKVLPIKTDAILEDGDYLTLSANGKYRLTSSDGAYFYLISKTDSGSSTLKIQATQDAFFRDVSTDLTTIQTQVTKLAGAEADSTFTLANSISEQDVVELTLTTRTKIHTLDLDVNALTKATTFRIYKKVDNTNYRLADTLNWDTVDSDVIELGGLVYNASIKITAQSAILEGATRDIPIKYISEAME